MTDDHDAFWAALRRSAELVRGLPQWTSAGIRLSAQYEGFEAGTARGSREMSDEMSDDEMLRAVFSTPADHNPIADELSQLRARVGELEAENERLRGRVTDLEMRHPARALIDNGDGTHTVPLASGLKSIIDSKNAHRVGQYNWTSRTHKNCPTSVHGLVYGRMVKLHRFILGEEHSRRMVDHINGDGLDNRECNLRMCTPGENSRNRGIMATNKTGYKGVTRLVRNGRVVWQAKIVRDRKQKFLGYFDTPEEAADAYDRAAVEQHGEFALTNADIRAGKWARHKGAAE